MTDFSGSNSEMPDFPSLTRPEVRAMDALLSGNCMPEEAPAGLRPVADVLAALQAPPDQREVAGWGEALIAYREMAGLPRTSGRPRSRRPRLTLSSVGARLAAAAGAVVVAASGGGIAAAYTGSLPTALQNLAHDTIAAPSVRESRATPAPAGHGHPAGPSATGPAAYGLCTAYQYAEEHGNASRRAVAFRNLASAAGGVGQVTAYCAPVQHPGATKTPGPTKTPGRRVGQGTVPPGTSHGRKPSTAPTIAPTTAPGSGKGNGGGNGNGAGKAHGKS